MNQVHVLPLHFGASLVKVMRWFFQYVCLKIVDSLPKNISSGMPAEFSEPNTCNPTDTINTQEPKLYDVCWNEMEHFDSFEFFRFEQHWTTRPICCKKDCAMYCTFRIQVHVFLLGGLWLDTRFASSVQSWGCAKPSLCYRAGPKTQPRQTEKSGQEWNDSRDVWMWTPHLI